MDPDTSDGLPSWRRWASIVAALLVLAFAVAAWSVWRMREVNAHDAQVARLQAAMEHEKGLLNELAALPIAPDKCPPGQVLLRAAAPLGARGGSRQASPASAPAAPAASTVSAAPSVQSQVATAGVEARPCG
jgi:hypothetical protein